MRNFLAPNLKHLLTHHKISITELANKLEISHAAVSKWLKADEDEVPSVSVQNILKISEIFGVSVDSLLKKDLCALDEPEIPLSDKVEKAFKLLQEVREQIRSQKKGVSRFRRGIFSRFESAQFNPIPA